MALDSLATPLGMDPGKPPRSVNPLRGRSGVVVLALLVALAAGYVGRTFLKRGTERGVVAVIQRVDVPMAAGRDGTALVERETRSGGSRSDAATAEADSGVKVIRQNGGQVPGGLVIKVPDSGNRGGTTGADPRVSEGSAAGILPRIGEGGLTPRAVYAAPFTDGPGPKIAVVMTGVGIGAQGTTDAISKLPGAVTLAFAPYGRDLPSQVARARREGHEIVLQVPMEPRDYPDSDPGPHTLRVGGEARTNIERLHWLMSRFPGYVGLMNFMGGKLMTQDAAYASLLEEINRRGLVFLDDGSNRDTKTARLAEKIGLPVRVADRLHETGGGKSLETQLAEIEAIARKTGSAVISVPALSANIERIAAWQRDLAGRGLVLAPLSAIIGK